MSQAELIRLLRQGTDAWNQWRSDYEMAKVDLVAADLEGISLIGANLWRANLWGANLWSADLREADLSEANLWSADLRGANLAGADLSAVNLWRANLSGADCCKARFVDSNLQEADLHGADLSDTNLCGADLWKADLRGVNLSQATIDTATKLDDKWRLVWEIMNSKVTNLNLGEANLREAFLWRANLSDASLVSTDLSGADLREANLQGADLWGAQLQQTDLTKANLSRADLWQANLAEADLTQANFSHANLQDAHLFNVQGLGTNFTAVTMTGACIEAWQINQNTILEAIDCEYIYLRENQQERCPKHQDKVFDPGEFAKLFQFQDTSLSLKFEHGINWKAFLLTFELLQAEWGKPNLSLLALESPTDDFLLVRLQVSPEIEIDRTALIARAEQIYETKVQALNLEQQNLTSNQQTENHIFSLRGDNVLKIIQALSESY
ncbi:MAG: pentapeptide repeat-containing protein [Microcoleaceae cyanobacterium]